MCVCVYVCVCVCVHVCVSMYLSTSLYKKDVTQGQFFKWNVIGLNSEFSFSKTGCYTKAEELSQPYYLPIFRERILGFIPFTRIFVQCKQPCLSSLKMNTVNQDHSQRQ